MTIRKREKLFGFGVDLLAAAALTAIGIVFSMIVHKGMPLSLVATVLLGGAVLAILRGYLWSLDQVGDACSAQAVRLGHMENAARLDAKRNQRPRAENGCPNSTENIGPFARTKSMV